jgi:hypothetical protein
LKPVGQAGLGAVIFLVVFPFVQVIVTFFTTGLAVATGDGVGVGV